MPTRSIISAHSSTTIFKHSTGGCFKRFGAHQNFCGGRGRKCSQNKSRSLCSLARKGFRGHRLTQGRSGEIKLNSPVGEVLQTGYILRVKKTLGKIKFFSDSHRRLVQSLLDRIRFHYGDRVVSLAIFGSYARGEPRFNSDLDLFLVLKDTSGLSRTQCTDEFVDQIEGPIEALRGDCEKDGIHMELSPFILSKARANSFLPIYLDMVKDHVLILDKDDFLQKKLKEVEGKMQRWGSQKKQVGGHWVWEIKPGLRWGEVIDYDQ